MPRKESLTHLTPHKAESPERGKINKPLIVLQGVNDARVLKAESDDVVAAVKKIGPAGRVRGVCGRGTWVHEEEPD